jgi:hypothetical protein
VEVRPQNTIDNDPEKYILRSRVSSICPSANKAILQEDGRRGEGALGSFLSYGEFAGGLNEGGTLLVQGTCSDVTRPLGLVDQRSNLSARSTG